MNYEILTHKGFKAFHGIINQGVPNTLLEITLSSGINIKCTEDHRFLLQSGNFCEAIDICPGDILFGNIKVEKIVEVCPETVYDLFNVEETNSYYTNGVISHNCSFIYIDECVTGDVTITIRNKNTGKIETIEISRAHEQIFDDSDFEILTEKGFRDFKGVYYIGNVPSTLKIEFNDGTSLRCTHGHEIKMSDGNFYTADSLLVGDSTSTQLVITGVHEINESVDVYDVNSVEETQSYLTNGVVSHNCAFVENWTDFYSSTYPTISSGESTKLLFTSTPNGLNHFYKFCDGAKNKTNGFQYVEVPWNFIPGRTEAWKKETLEAMNNDYERFAVEFECQFAGSSNTLISGGVLKSLFSKDPLVSMNEMHQYEEPINGHRYVMTVDVSRGKGQDYSAFQIIDVTSVPYKQVCVYRNNMITPADFASVIDFVSKKYNGTMILIEVNDIGGQVAETLYMDYENENIICTEHGGAAGRRISGGFGPNVDRGIRTTKTVKKIGCSTLKLLIEQEQLILNDQETINELSTFSKKGETYEAEAGKHDDLVMCLVLFSWMSTQPYFKDITDINTMMHLRDKTEQEIADSMMDFFSSDGTESYREDTIDLTQNYSPEFAGFF